MKKLIFAILLLPSIVVADQYVRGYTRKDGTYVEGHYRSSPNKFKFDNYSSHGNTNPYNGKKGYAPNEIQLQPIPQVNPNPYMYNNR